MIFVSINFVRIWHELIFVIALIEFVSLSIHRIVVIFLRLYDWRRHIKSIINRFFDVMSSFTRQSYNNRESVSSIIERERIFKIRWMIDLMTESASNSCVIAYNSIVKTFLIILLHFVKNQWMMFALLRSLIKQIIYSIWKCKFTLAKETSINIINFEDEEIIFSRTKFNLLIEWSNYHWRRRFKRFASSSLELVTWAARDKSKLTFDWDIVAIYVSRALCVTY
jgi:hypothetical protein